MDLKQKLNLLSEYFDQISMEFHPGSVELAVGILRPYNSPKFKSTMADRKRRRVSMQVNLALSEKEFSGVEEAVDFILVYIGLYANKKP